MKWILPILVFLFASKTIGIAVNSLFFVLELVSVIKHSEDPNLKYLIIAAISPFASTYLAGRLAPKSQFKFVVICNVVELLLAFAAFSLVVPFLMSKVESRNEVTKLIAHSNPAQFILVSLASSVLGCVAVYIFEKQQKRKPVTKAKKRRSSKKR